MVIIYIHLFIIIILYIELFIQSFSKNITSKQDSNLGFKYIKHIY